MSAPMETIDRRGLMLVLSSPSGAGKTTIARRVLAEDPGIAASISHTTRPRFKNPLIYGNEDNNL